jgi:Clr5 domain
MELYYPKYSHFFAETPLWIVHNDGQHGLDYPLPNTVDVHTELAGLAGLFPAVSQPAQDLLHGGKLSLLASKDRSHLQTYTRVRKISPRAWQKAQPAITKLYVGKRRTLREVMPTMKNQYGIDAS